MSSARHTSDSVSIQQQKSSQPRSTNGSGGGGGGSDDGDGDGDRGGDGGGGGDGDGDRSVVANDSVDVEDECNDNADERHEGETDGGGEASSNGIPGFVAERYPAAASESVATCAAVKCIFSTSAWAASLSKLRSQLGG